MTNEQIVKAIQNLIERMNRIEARTAHQSKVVAIDPAINATEAAICVLDRAIAATQAQTNEYLRLAAGLRDAK